MEKTIILRDTEITFSIWDLGGQKEFLSMLPLVCNDAVAIFFMFDLTRKATLLSIKEWYRQARLLNRVNSILLSVLLLNHCFLIVCFSCFSDRSSVSRGHKVRYFLHYASRRD
jgi:GTPase SAR1 family protein